MVALALELRGSVGTTIINNTELPLNQVVEYIQSPTHRPATNSSAVGSECMYFLGKQFNQAVPTGSASFDIASVFNAIGANGQCARFGVLIRRAHENTSPLCYSGFIQVNSAKEFGLYVLNKTSSAAYIEPTITSGEVITLRDNRAGTAIYSLNVTPN